MMRATAILILLACGAAPTLRGQYLATRRDEGTTHAAPQLSSDAFRRAAPHYGKWLTAAATLGLTLLAAEQHRLSRREWDALLAICRSAEDACALGPDGRYVRTDAEQLYQRSRTYDRRANRWLLGAQGSLLVTTALFIIDLHPGEGPDNIPLAPVKVGLRLQF